MSEALRFNNDKPMMSYFMRSFPKMAEAVARVKEMGAIKYNDGNWRLGNKPDKEYWNSMFRHLNYIFGGEFYDSDTGCLHIAHAVWNLCALLELNYPDLPARDEAIWAERAVHWAEEKRKREAAEEKRKDEEAVEGWAASCAERWASVTVKDQVRSQKEVIRETPPVTQGVEVTCEFVWDPAVDVHECPACGFDTSWQTALGARECVFCGEIFDVPIGPETEVAKETKFTIGNMEREPSFMELMGKLMATRDDEVRSREEVEKSEFQGSLEKFVTAMDSVLNKWRQSHAEFMDNYFKQLEREEDDWKVECPKCGYDLALEGACGMESDSNIECRGVYGLECCRCHEIFEVPIGPESPALDDSMFYGRNGFPAELFPRRKGTPLSPIIGEANVECLACGAQFVGLREDGLCKCECGELFGAIFVPKKED